MSLDKLPYGITQCYLLPDTSELVNAPRTTDRSVTNITALLNDGIDVNGTRTNTFTRYECHSRPRNSQRLWLVCLNHCGIATSLVTLIRPVVVRSILSDPVFSTPPSRSDFRFPVLIYATADEAVAYMFCRCFFVFFCFFLLFPSVKNMRQPFSATAERIFMKLLPNDTGQNGV